MHNSSLLPSNGLRSPLKMVPVTFHTFTFGLLPPPPVWQLVLTCQMRKEERGRLTKSTHASSVTVLYSCTDNGKSMEITLTQWNNKHDSSSGKYCRGKQNKQKSYKIWKMHLVPKKTVWIFRGQRRMVIVRSQSVAVIVLALALEVFQSKWKQERKYTLCKNLLWQQGRQRGVIS